MYKWSLRRRLYSDDRQNKCVSGNGNSNKLTSWIPRHPHDKKNTDYDSSTHNFLVHHHYHHSLSSSTRCMSSSKQKNTHSRRSSNDAQGLDTLHGITEHSEARPGQSRLVSQGSSINDLEFFSGILNPPSPMSTLTSMYHKFFFSIFDPIYPEK